MSISSMLDSEAEKPSREGSSTSRTNGYATRNPTSHSGLGAHGGPTASPIKPTSISRQPTQRPGTPERYKDWRDDNPRSLPTYTGGSIQHPFPYPTTLSDNYRIAPPLQPQHNAQPTFHENPLDSKSYIEQPTRHTGRFSNSGPENPSTNSTPDAFTTFTEPVFERERFQPLAANFREPRMDLGNRANSRDSVIYADVGVQPHTDGTGASAAQAGEVRPLPPSQPPSPYAVRQDHEVVTRHANHPFSSRSAYPVTGYDQAALSDSRNAAEAVSRIEDPGLPNANQPTSANTSLRGALESGDGDNNLTQQQDMRHPSNISDTSRQRRSQGSPISPPSSSIHSNFQNVDKAGNSDDLQPQPKGLAALLMDSSKQRAGRLSPLPQAVQGAQGRKRGPASEPGVKNEFGRMFLGIGSGVGSAMSTPAPPENTGPPLPFPSSPMRVDDLETDTPSHVRSDLIAMVKTRIASRGGRKSRKVKEEDAKGENESPGGQNVVRSFSGRGTKRSRQSYNIDSSH